MGFIEGSKSLPLESEGVPTNGVSHVDSVNVSASSGTYVLSFQGFRTTPLAFNANGAAIQAAMEALPSIGAGNISVVGNQPSTAQMTFQGSLARKSLPALIVDRNDTDGSILQQILTPGSDGFRRGSGEGALVIDVTNAKSYINTGTEFVPAWTVVGTQT